MRSRCLAIIVAVMAVALASCSAAPTNEFSRQDREQITKFVKDFAAAYNTKDPVKLVPFYSGSAILMPPNASTVRGQESIQGYYQNRLGVDGATDLQIEPREISGQGSLAYMSGTFSLNLKPEGKPEGHDRGKILFILRSLAKNWKIEISMWSSDLPPVIPEKPAEAPAKK
jgi:ketosteroid isomerase-like protein